MTNPAESGAGAETIRTVGHWQVPALGAGTWALGAGDPQPPVPPRLKICHLNLSALLSVKTGRRNSSPSQAY
jgi:hypothetical protein